MHTDPQRTPVRRRRRRRRSQLGMTLIEIMVVLAIISLILGGVGVMAFNRFRDAQLDEAKNQVTQIHQLVEQYMLTKRKCPKNLQEIKAAGIASKVSKDPWGGEYEIHCEQGSAEAIEVKSGGPDAQLGSDDDITSRADESNAEVDTKTKDK